MSTFYAERKLKLLITEERIEQINGAKAETATFLSILFFKLRLVCLQFPHRSSPPLNFIKIINYFVIVFIFYRVVSFSDDERSLHSGVSRRVEFGWNVGNKRDSFRRLIEREGDLDITFRFFFAPDVRVEII
jgi:hypothetical protein